MGSKRIRFDGFGEAVRGGLGKLSAADIFLALAFAFVAIWAVWFGVSCLSLGAPFEGAVALVSAVVFALCGVVLVRQRVTQSADERDAEWGPATLAVDATVRAGGERGKKCEITCRASGIVFDFDGAWTNFVPYESVAVTSVVGRRSLALTIPGPKGELPIRVALADVSDRDSLLMAFVANRVRGAHIPESAQQQVPTREATDRMVDAARRRVSEEAGR